MFSGISRVIVTFEQVFNVISSGLVVSVSRSIFWMRRNKRGGVVGKYHFAQKLAKRIGSRRGLFSARTVFGAGEGEKDGVMAMEKCFT